MFEWATLQGHSMLFSQLCNVDLQSLCRVYRASSYALTKYFCSIQYAETFQYVMITVRYQPYQLQHSSKLNYSVFIDIYIQSKYINVQFSRI